MNTKEIAEATGKDVSTVQRWIKKMNGKMQSIDSKMQSSNSTNPADFDLTETILIIENGMGKNAAALYRMSAQPRQYDDLQPVQNGQVDKLGAMVASLAVTMNESMKMMQESMRMMVSQQSQINALSSSQKQIDFIQDYFSIKGYSNKTGQQLTFSEALATGRIAGKLSREREIEIRKVDDESFGQVNSYHVDILKEVFSV